MLRVSINRAVGKDNIQQQLEGAKGNKHVYEKIARELHIQEDTIHTYNPILNHNTYHVTFTPEHTHRCVHCLLGL